MTSETDRKSTRLNSSHTIISYAVFCLKKKKKQKRNRNKVFADRQRREEKRTRCDLSSARGQRPGVCCARVLVSVVLLVFFFFLMIRRPPRSTLFPSTPLFRSNDTATTEIYTLSLHDALRSRWSPYHLTQPFHIRAGPIHSVVQRADSRALVCASTPCEASTTSTAPSQADSERLTS